MISRVSQSSLPDGCTACTQIQIDPGQSIEQIEELIDARREEMSVRALVLRVQKTAGGITAARNAAARLCKLGSFIATGVGPRQPTPTYCLISYCCKSNLSKSVTSSTYFFG